MACRVVRSWGGSRRDALQVRVETVETLFPHFAVLLDPVGRRRKGPRFEPARALLTVAAARDEPRTLEHQARDIAAVIEELGLTGVHLVGHSLGAAIALTYATEHAHRLRSLTLVSTPSPAGTPTPPQGYQLLAQMRDDHALLTQALASVMPARAPDALFQRLVDDAAGQAPVAFTATAEALEGWRLAREQRGRLRLPVLLMWGDRDQIVERKVQNDLLLSLPGANNLEVFQGCGHSPMLERTEGFAAALLDFISQEFDTYAVVRESADS